MRVNAEEISQPIMPRQSDHIKSVPIEKPRKVFLSIPEYTQLLINHSLEYKVIDCYLQVGEVENAKGWILTLSCVGTQLENLFNRVLPELILRKYPFKIPKNKEVADILIDGGLGLSQLGRIVLIWQKSGLVREVKPWATSRDGM
jgi:hypothetical protein